MDGISLAASIVAVLQLTSSVVRYINDVNDGQEERLRLRNEISSAYGPLQMLHDRIADEEERAAEYQEKGTRSVWLSSVMALAAKRGPLEQYKDVLEALQREKDRFMDPSKRRFNVTMKQLTWPFKRTDIQGYIKVVERQKMMFLLALQNDNLTLAQAIKEETSLLPEMSERLGEIAETVGKMTLNDDVADRRTVVQWLSPLNFFLTHNFLIGRCEPGTGQWLLDSSIFKSWVNGDTKTLWCPGIPGAGKTMLSAIIVDNLRNQSAHDSGVGIASIYCNYKEEDEQSQENLVAGVWRQLIHNKNALSDDVKAVYKEHADKDTRPTLKAVAEILAKEIARFRIVYVVVDALDELPEARRIRLMDTLQKIQDSQTGLRLLFTSRMYDSIARHFEGQPRLEIKASTEDVREYVKGRISKGSRLERHVLKDPTLVKEIENIVAGKAEKMFLLAQLHMDSLQEVGSPKAVRRALARLPEDLDATYERAMQRIAAQGTHDKQYAELILQWISFATRQLSVDELLEALAVEEDTEELDRSNILDAELLTSVCCGLVIVDQMSKVVRLVHFSTQEYFRRVRSVRFPRAQEQISRTCLTYLSYDVFSEGACPDDETADARIEENHLLWYAAENWGEHARGVPETLLEDQILDLLSDDDRMSSLVQAMHFHPDKNRHVGFPRDVTGLHLAAHFGLQHIINRLLEDGADVSARDSLGSTPLHEAADRGHAEIVEILLSNGADIEAQDFRGLTALQLATLSGHEKVVLGLLSRGAAISKHMDGRTALHFAAEYGNEAIAKALLGSGADAAAESNEIPDDAGLNKFIGGRTPLHWAAEYGYTSLAKLLLESGADVNATNTSGRTPLQEAIMWSNVPMVEFLLEQGASVSIQDISGWSPLHEAAYSAPPEVTTMLLDRGADPECTNGIIGQKWVDGVVPHGDDYVNGARTPLYTALRYGRFDVVEVLLKKGADLRHRDFYGVSPLHLSVMYEKDARDFDRIPVLNALLDAGEDVEEKLFGLQETPLHMAARAGRADCVRLLLERGADRSVRNLKGDTAEMIATAAGKEEVVRILKEFGDGGKSRE